MDEPANDIFKVPYYSLLKKQKKGWYFYILFFIKIIVLCMRIYFLEKNHALYKNGMERINNDALATLTILVASSRPEDKEIMMELIKTIIK